MDRNGHGQAAMDDMDKQPWTTWTSSHGRHGQATMDDMDKQPWTKWTGRALSILSMAARPCRPWLLVHVHFGPFRSIVYSSIPRLRDKIRCAHSLKAYREILHCNQFF